MTLRALGQAAGLSHNAPYKHFASRSALLAAVAARSFGELASAAEAMRSADLAPIEKLRSGIALMTDFSRRRPALYALLFNNAETAAAGGEVAERAFATFEQFRMIVEECQQAGDLPDAPSQMLAGLIFASVQGLLSIEANGAMRPEKGLSSVESSVDLLLALVSPKSTGR